MRFTTLLILAVSLISCGNEKKQSTSTDLPATDEWVTLFDGKSLNGWQVFKGKPNNTWEVVDGMLHCKPMPEGTKDIADKRSDLMTTVEYADFELVFEWKVAAEANSGVMFRVTEEFEQPYYSGPEYQVIDDIGYPGDLKDSQLTGANYDVHATAIKKLNPAGEWNSGKIVAHGNHIEHWLNEQKVVEYEIGSADWKERVAASKWKEFTGYAMAKKGHIDLQDHGNEVWFRNVKIREIK